MNRDEWINVVQVEQALWPHASFSSEVVTVQFEFVKDVPYSLAVEAVKALAAREHPPNSAMIAQKVGELTEPSLPGWDEVRPALRKMLSVGYGAERAPSLQGWESQGYHPIFAAYFTAQRWRLFCLTDEGDSTFNAQQRDEWRSICGRAERELQLLAVGVDRSLIRGAPEKLDAVAALGLPSNEREDA